MKNYSNTVIRFSEQTSPVECYKLQILSLIYTVLFFLSLAINGIIFLAYLLNRSSKSAIQLLVFSHTVINILATITEFPVLIISDALCRWPYGQDFCTVSGFIVYFIGCVSVYIMVAISLERYYTCQNKNVSATKVLMMILVSIVLSAFWAMMPLFGWSYYSQESSLTSCCVEWLDRSIQVVSYNVTIFIFIFFLPIGIILYTQIKIYSIISQKSFVNDKRRSQDRYLVFTMSVYVFIFMFAWTPYAAVSFISAFIDDYNFDPLVSTIPALFAKSSVIWSSLFYLCTDEKMKFLVKTRIFRVEIKPKSQSLNPEIATFRKSEERGEEMDSDS